MNAINRPRVPAIIKRPDLVNPTKRSILAIIAAIGWILWIYLLMPLGAVLAWWFGYQRLDLFILVDPVRTTQTLKIYAIIIAAGGVLFILWATYNWLRFRRIDRRGAPPMTDAKAISQAFLIEPSDVNTAQAGKVVAFDFDENGQIIQVETDSAALAHLSSVKSAATATDSAN
ncbi:MAG: poly-beta-1,6-N-acetyl-D-glucosamine biosynthesis protein PgaD [Halothiobacillus sp.]|nr:poly-beta-1,6-N-acetyl-D-glucosamine biosynthesis protein PgaD [Halothiobacillus sp.]